MRYTWLGVLLWAGGPCLAEGNPEPWLAQDKALHVGISAVLGAATYIASPCLAPPTAARIGVSFGVPMAIGLAKEGWDLSGRGDPSWRDLVADGVGAATGVGLAHFTLQLKASHQVGVSVWPGLNGLSVTLIN